MKLSERIKIDDDRDVVTVDGYRISGAVLETLLSQPTRPGRWFRIEELKPDLGVIIVREKQEESCHAG